MSNVVKSKIGPNPTQRKHSGFKLTLGAGLVVLFGHPPMVMAQQAQREELRQITQPAGAMPAYASTLTIYGLIDTSVAYASSPTGRIAKVDSGHMNGSRLGFRGTEDLGGGLRANFQLEAGVNVDSGTSGQNQGAGAKFFGRGALVGLSGNWGELRMGRTLAAISSEVQAVGDPFGLGGAGNLQGIQPTVGRSNNTLWYQTPSMSSLIVKTAYSFGERSGGAGITKNGGAQIAGSAIYTNKALSAAIGYTSMRNLLSDHKVQWLHSGVGYDFGVFKAFGSFATFKNPGAAITPDVHAQLDNNLQMAGFPSVGYYSGQNDRSVSLGVAVPLGAHTILGQVVRVDDHGPLNRDANHFGVAYLYALSKRTTLYADYGKVINKNGAGYNLNGATSQAALSSNGNSDALHIGVRHSF